VRKPLGFSAPAESSSLMAERYGDAREDTRASNSPPILTTARKRLLWLVSVAGLAGAALAGCGVSVAVHPVVNDAA
jgi:hypothetical protein